METIFKEYGPDGSGDAKREVFCEYALLQTRFRETDGINIHIGKRISIKKKKTRIFN